MPDEKNNPWAEGIKRYLQSEPDIATRPEDDNEVPTYTLMWHEVREEFKLSATEYLVVDSIDKLSNTIRYPYCRRDRRKLAEWLGLSRATVFRAVDVAVKKGLIERNSYGLRTTNKWIQEVKYYQTKANKNKKK